MHVCVCVYARVRGCAHTCTRTYELDKLNQATGVWLQARGKECGIRGTFHEPRAHSHARVPRGKQYFSILRTLTYGTRLGDLKENWFPFVFQLNTQHTRAQSDCTTTGDRGAALTRVRLE
jgi:hypothetical protein